MHNVLICPICGRDLIKNERVFRCESNHSFDISKEGYVNLLMSNKKNSHEPGDNKLMVSSREAFLSKDFYNKLREKLIEVSLIYKPNKSVVLDCGCGTGYYTTEFYRKRNTFDEFYGVDISKFAVQKAAKKAKEITYFTASVFDLPIKNKSIDLIFNIFAPKLDEEIKRILKDDGVVLEVLPGEDHLIELKEILYDVVRKNKEEYSSNILKLKEIIPVKYKINLSFHEDIMSLLSMTPYMYKTKKEDIEKLNQIDKLSLTIDFNIIVWAL